MRLLDFTRRVRFLATSLALIACSTSISSSASPNEHTVMIVNANVVTGDGRDILENRAVTIIGQKIVSIDRMDSVKIPLTTEVIDAQNSYLLPGFIDTHVHIGLGPVGLNMEGEEPILYSSPSDTIADQTLNTLLKYGVTTARDPGGSSKITIAAKRRLDARKIAGPKLFVAGDIIDTARFDNLAATVATENDVRAEVTRQVEAGVDWIKLYTGLSKEMVAAGIDEAHKHGAKVTGHLHETTWTEASTLGIDSIVHIIPGSSELLPLDKRAEYEASILGKATFMLKWFEDADFTSPEINEMIVALRKNNVSIDPTLVIFHAMAFGDGEAYFNNPALDQVSPELIENWRSMFNFNFGWTPEDFEYAKSVWPRVEEFTRLLHRSGVHLTVGTDANNPWVVPGESFHTELELLVQAGISERDVVTLATKNGAELLGVIDSVGTISPEKQADLVLVKSNPYEDIRSTRKIIWVMQNGEIQ